MVTIEDEEKKELQQLINGMKNGSIEQMLLITVYSLKSYFGSLLAFGRKSKITRDNLNVIKEMFFILRNERTLLNFVLRNMDIIDIQAAQDVVWMLDDVNDKTVEYYYNVIEDIEDAVECNQEFRGLRPKLRFPTLIDESSYASEVIALCENFETLKSFLGFEDEFWTFIKDKTKKVDTSIEVMTKMTYAIPIYDENGIVVSVHLMLPKVSNLETALLAIKIYKKAYNIYKMIGMKYSAEVDDGSLSLQEEYKNKYLPKKAKDMLDLKNVKY